MFQNYPLVNELLETCRVYIGKLTENVKTIFITYFNYLEPRLNVNLDYLPLGRKVITDNPLPICVATAVVLLLGAIVISLLCKSKLNHSGKHISFESCKSPDCVRCAKFKDILHVSYKRFNQYLKEKGFSLNSVDGLSYKRIQLSFQELGFEKGKVKTETELDKGSILPFQKPTVFTLTNVTSRPFWEGVYRVDMQYLEKNIDSIRLEFERAFNLHVCEEMKYWTRNSTSTGNWSVFSLVNQGNVVTRNVELCPNTWSVVKSMRCFMQNCVFGNVVFSVVYPNTIISEHCGPTNTRIRCHLGLQVPEDCSLTVNGVTRRWTEGHCLLFDDSYFHSVQYKPAGKRNPSTETEQPRDSRVYTVDMSKLRVVLMVDLWHPWLTEQERQALTFAFSSRATYTSHQK